ncbi:methylmalonyl Co-A mutase-associated GTPase MeaB [Paradesertivirga mongoliensis]|uniref:Methylmalonyl Co-A mutase-associated GTPase MeaB n=1 Tax=Paradesertivirga mongoliensis TaxID=2100740 RepID=A0ABW4ZIR7_9SPHI|nr:methylmalonyl Co-A mutase-associated GTPase MeaB [Pedobacter mongoliensis]
MSDNIIRDPNFKSFREISRSLTVVENGLEGAQKLLKNLKIGSTPVIGITGPPGAGKSTLLAGLIDELLKENLSLAVLAVDPTSPFTYGSLLGDRIRMQSYATHPQLFIRSVATRGSLGGLSGKIIEMTDVLKSYSFDYIFIETVGVGQSEVEIASLADLTMVVLVPESGDEVQSIKAGIMEIGDAFIVNKADREGADRFEKNIRLLSSEIPVFKTVATTGRGLSELAAFIKSFKILPQNRTLILAKKAWELIKEQRMSDINLATLEEQITAARADENFNIYSFVESRIKSS